MAQSAAVLWFADDGNTNLATINARLSKGQNVLMVSPMSGTGEQGPEDPQSAFPYSRAAIIFTPGTAHQQAFVLWFGDDGNTNLAALNSLLSSGWNVSKLVAMSGTGEHGPETPQSGFPYSRALVILQQG